MVNNVPDVNDPQYDDNFEDYVVIDSNNIVVDIQHAQTAEFVQNLFGSEYTVKLFDRTKPYAWIGAEFLGDELGYSKKPFIQPTPPTE